MAKEHTAYYAKYILSSSLHAFLNTVLNCNEIKQIQEELIYLNENGYSFKRLMLDINRDSLVSYQIRDNLSKIISLLNNSNYNELSCFLTICLSTHFAQYKDVPLSYKDQIYWGRHGDFIRTIETISPIPFDLIYSYYHI